MFRNFPMVKKVVYGRGCFDQLDDILADVRGNGRRTVAFLVDDVFEKSALAGRVPVRGEDRLIWIDVGEEPKTSDVDRLTDELRAERPAGVIGIGGGSVMDLAKAVAIMLENPGSSVDYQGWDLVKNPAVYHAGVPTLSGTGAEVSRTAVLSGPEKKLGINSDYTVFDQVVLDPDLIRAAPRDQRFYTGMDCYIHCVESLSGTYKTTFSQAYAEKALDLCRRVFNDDHTPESDEMLMVASYWGGMSIANSQVGVAHAMSYGLSFVLGLRHGLGNCVAFNQLEEFYPEGAAELKRMMDKHRIDLPSGVTAKLSESEMDTMVDVSLGMAPLWENAVGADWESKVSKGRVRELYSRM